jgi:glutathione S-transferase
MYTLHYSPSSASMVVHLMLLELGVPHRLERVDTSQPRTPGYLALNPLGQVPTLIVDGRPVTETSALLMLLAERHPEAGLAPLPGSATRAEYLQWMVLLSNQLMATFRYWFYPGELGSPEHPPEVRAALQARIEGVFARLDAHLAARGPYLLGERLSAADLLLTMLMRWSRRMPRTALDWPALARLANLVRARPSWQRLYAVEELTEW